MTLREWQAYRLERLEDPAFEFKPSRHADSVTVLAYAFPPPGREAEMFKWLKCSMLHTWSLLGTLKTVVVADRGFPEARAFAERHSNVELQIADGLVPGNIKTMSLDCIKNLHSRFSTPYCLIVQDDGFPLRDNLCDFLGRYDFIGAPIISDGWKRKLAYMLRFGSFNGGFSLRSRAFCGYASRMWFSFFSRFMPEDHRHLGEDFYYTTLLKLLPRTWLDFKFPSEKEAFRFAVDSLGGAVALPGIDSFGFHGRHTAETIAWERIG